MHNAKSSLACWGLKLGNMRFQSTMTATSKLHLRNSWGQQGTASKTCIEQAWRPMLGQIHVIFGRKVEPSLSEMHSASWGRQGQGQGILDPSTIGWKHENLEWMAKLTANKSEWSCVQTVSARFKKWCWASSVEQKFLPSGQRIFKRFITYHIRWSWRIHSSPDPSTMQTQETSWRDGWKSPPSLGQHLVMFTRKRYCGRYIIS